MANATSSANAFFTALGGPNVKLLNKWRTEGGRFFCDPSDTKRLDYIKSELDVLRRVEPDSGWYAETRGTSYDWHRTDW